MGTSYAPLTSTYTTGDFTVSNPDLSGNIYLAVPFNESVSSGDVLTIRATTNAGIVYQATKAAPSGGFKNGRYYTSSGVSLRNISRRTITVGIISYCFDGYGWTNYSDYKLHYWGGADGTQDVSLNSLDRQETKDVGYWSTAQTFYMSSVEVPADITGFKVWYSPSNRWFGDDADASLSSKAYIFNYTDDKAVYE